MAPPIRILLLSGSLRDGSTNTALLRTAALLAPEGVDAVLYDGASGLPLFRPDLDDDRLPAPAAELRRAIRAADALLISTPEYAGALPAALKNVLEWAVGDADPRSIYRKPVAWINVSSAPTGAADAHASLRIVLGYVHATIVEVACVHLPVARDRIGPSGTVTDPGVRDGLAGALAELALAARGTLTTGQD